MMSQAKQGHTAAVLERLRTEAQLAKNSGDKPILTRSFELAIAEIERLIALTALQAPTQAKHAGLIERLRRASIVNLTGPDHMGLEEIKGTCAEALSALERSTPTLPAFRCDNCDNGVEIEWKFCAWCGGGADWAPAPVADQR